MSKITAIETQKKNPKRVNLFIDGEFAFALTRITAAWFKVGDELSTEKIMELQSEDAREKAYQQALLLLSFRARSETELRTNLHKHLYPDAVIEATLDRLRQDGLADDDQFARTWVENRNTFRPRSRLALSSELKRKGLNPEVIESALTNVNDHALAYEAARKKALRYEGLEWNQYRRKMGDFLARRGFSYSVATLIVNRIWNETHEHEKLPEAEDLT